MDIGGWESMVSDSGFAMGVSHLSHPHSGAVPQPCIGFSRGGTKAGDRLNHFHRGPSFGHWRKYGGQTFVLP